MKIVEIFKNFFRTNKKSKEQKLLPEGKTIEKTDEFKKNLYVGNVETLRQPSLEECIEEFIKQYSIQEEYNPKGSRKAYKAYSRMFCEEEDAGDNFKNQERLKNLVKKNGCNTNYQVSNNRIVYMHISGENGLDQYKDTDIEKIYINCARKDISVITAAIFKEIKEIAKDKLQMKCVSEQIINNYGVDEEYKELKNYQRNDRIVIYAEDHEMAEKMCNAISLLKQNNPKLFKGVKGIPILPNRDGFMVVDEKKSGQSVQTPVGTASGDTFNAYVSDILYESVISGFDKEFEIPKDDSSSLSERMAEYSRIFPEINEEQKNKIILECANIFKSVCKDANIELADSKNQEEKNSIEK